ncbi:zinc-binding domain-containing protein [Cladorrhinum sp. PSN259]|nr:zinc-binding domain-containing protein [Cladorrhinum sp. PSN259]
MASMLTQGNMPSLPCPDWVLSSSNVHVARDRSWFGNDYVAFRSHLADGLVIEGVGSVTLSVKRSPTGTGRSNHTTLLLTNVLHVPGAICNILGLHEYELDVNFQEPLKSSIQDQSGQRLACFREVKGTGLLALRLSGPPHGPQVGPSSLSAIGLNTNAIVAVWPEAEKQIWASYQALMDAPAKTGDSGKPTIPPATRRKSGPATTRPRAAPRPEPTSSAGFLPAGSAPGPSTTHPRAAPHPVPASSAGLLPTGSASGPSTTRPRAAPHPGPTSSAGFLPTGSASRPKSQPKNKNMDAVVEELWQKFARAVTLEEETDDSESFMFPSLHENVRNAVSKNLKPTIWFNENNSDDGYNNDYNTSVMGTFECKNKRCRKKGWNSKKVATWIRGYPNGGYSAEVFNQHCKACDQLGVFTLDEQSYVDRVSYRIQKWAGIHLERPDYSGVSKGPHQKQFCEGCKHGHCEALSDSDSDY